LIAVLVGAKKILDWMNFLAAAPLEVDPSEDIVAADNPDVTSSVKALPRM